MDAAPLASAASAPRAAAPSDESGRRAAAEALEASFLAEMLKQTPLNANPDGFGGGAGEDAFGSFLTREYARLLSERGGFGLAERIFEAIKARDGAA